MLAGHGRDVRRALSFDLAAEALGATGIDRERWTAVAPWRPLHDALAAAGYVASAMLDNGARDFDVVLVRLGRQRQRSLARIAEALDCVAADGIVVVTGENDLGAAAYAKLLPRAAKLSRHHGRGYSLRPADAPATDLRATWRADAALRRHPGHGYVTAPGIFAWDRIDAGSALLARSLPLELSGRIADLGAGWGFLALAALDRCPAVERVDLYEADWLALDAARENLRGRPADFQWHDATRPLPRSGYDAVIANPPFHAARRADPGIGLAVIRAAAGALARDGVLWLVANRHLPYEATLRSSFTAVRTIAEEDGYKVMSARGPRAQNVPG